MKNFIKSTWRQLTRHKIYTTINLAGLAIGIACGLVIYKIISYEAGFDRYQKNYSTIYRVINRYELPEEGIVYGEGQVHPLGEAIRNDFPGVNAVMTYYAGKGQVIIENDKGTIDRYLENEGLAYAEPELFEIFDFDFLAGNPNNALSDEGSVVITSSLAQKYFKLAPGNVSGALGRPVNINNKETFTITGVIADTPENTDLPFTLIADYRGQTASNPYFNNGADWNEYASRTNCYLQLPVNVSPADFENQLVPFLTKYIGPDSPVNQKYMLQPLSELHYGSIDNYNERQVPKRSLYLLGFIGLFIILLGSVNFINLSTAQSSRRFKEIGVRKIAGVSKFQLISQFMGETMLISCVAAFIGVLIARLLFNYLDGILGYRLNLDLLGNPGTVLFLILSALAIGFISGLYPSFVMARMNPVGSLKNELPATNSSHSGSLRRTLVIFQFAISLILITGTFVMRKQIRYFLNSDIGFNKEAILVVPLPGGSPENLAVMKSELLNNPDILNVSFETRSPMADYTVGNPINYPTLDKDIYIGNLKTVDEDYLDLYQLKLIAGQNISERKSTGEAIVNRSLTELLGFDDPNEAVGEMFKYGRGNFEFTITGVVEDFHAQSLQKEMNYVILSNLAFNINEMAVKINPATVKLAGYSNTIGKVEKEWNKLFPKNIFEYRFLDRQIASFYSGEINTFKLIELFAIIAIFIASLGLYGLISFIANQRIKEIGIRKVNGARIIQVITMLNISFLRWISIASVISIPAAWYLMNKWLANFAFRITINWWIFAMALITALVIAMMTVSRESWRAATMNPVDALRYE